MRIRTLVSLAGLLVAPLAAYQGTGGGFASGPLRIGGGVSAPVAVFKPQPEYTPEEREARIEGDVWISVVIDEKGIPTNLKVVRSLHARLDAQALAAVAKWRFKPGFKEGQPVAVRATLAVGFKLADAPSK